MNSSRASFAAARHAFACAGVIAASLVASAQVVPVPATPVVGSSNPASAEPPVTRPSTRPCTVTLFSNEAFNDYSAHPLTFAPPAGCRGPWARVVLTVDFTVTAGIQYDRTASLYLGNANIFYGTTAEPTPTLSPSWHVERDVTDLSALFKAPQTGQAILYNIYNSTYNGGIYGTAKLLFYPADLRNPPPPVPDVVVPVSGANSPYELDTTASQVTTTFTAPRNTAAAFLDVIAQSQQKDEFWYYSVPNNLTDQLESYGNTSFRETEVSIDGKPAGVAPVYPWIFTGGLDPNLWSPIPGVQTLNFKPYRVDLSPFAGVLADGQPHTVGVSVFNANSYFLATANLLLFEDHGRAETGGGLIENTLTEPNPQVNENLQTDGLGNTTGTVTVTSNRSFSIKGYVNTSLGRVETTVAQTVDFKSTQTFDVGNTIDVQNAVQTTTVDANTTRQLGPLTEVSSRNYSYPLTVDFSYVQNADGSLAETVASDQQNIFTERQLLNGFELTSSRTEEHVKTTDTEKESAAGVLTTGPTDSSAYYLEQSPLGQCYSRSLASKNGVLTRVSTDASCDVH